LSAPLAPDEAGAEAAEADSESLISCRYSGGNPLGITFEWFEDNQHLEISEISAEDIGLAKRNTKQQFFGEHLSFTGLLIIHIVHRSSGWMPDGCLSSFLSLHRLTDGLPLDSHVRTIDRERI
jgi:hypothetical protein